MLSIEEVNSRMSKKGLLLLDKYKVAKNYYNIKCYCGNVFQAQLSNIFHGGIYSCGCYKSKMVSKRSLKDLTGQRFGRLLVFSRCKNKHDYRKAYWHCLCDCGCLHIVNGSSLLSGNTKSCGCYQFGNPQKKLNPLDGKKFGKLLVLNYDHTSKIKGVMYNCICDCGHKCLATYYQLIQGVMPCCNSCNNNNLFKNGLPTSYKALKLHEMIGQGEHNYTTNVVGNIKCINVDIAILEKKIIIEYDEWYWHKNCLEKDKDQTQKLINNRWYVIRVLARQNLPTQKQIDKALVEVYNTNPYIIQLDGWGD